MAKIKTKKKKKRKMKVEKSLIWLTHLFFKKKNKMTFNHPENHFIEVHAMISKKRKEVNCKGLAIKKSATGKMEALL